MKKILILIMMLLLLSGCSGRDKLDRCVYNDNCEEYSIKGTSLAFSDLGTHLEIETSLLTDNTVIDYVLQKGTKIFAFSITQGTELTKEDYDIYEKLHDDLIIEINEYYPDTKNINVELNIISTQLTLAFENNGYGLTLQLMTEKKSLDDALTIYTELIKSLYENSNRNVVVTVTFYSDTDDDYVEEARLSFYWINYGLGFYIYKDSEFLTEEILQSFIDLNYSEFSTSIVIN